MVLYYPIIQFLQHYAQQVHSIDFCLWLYTLCCCSLHRLAASVAELKLGESESETYTAAEAVLEVELEPAERLQLRPQPQLPAVAFWQTWAVV